MSVTMYAFLSALSLFICYGGNWLIGQCMIERPLVVGAVTGILLGDIPTGVAIGAALETIYMGAVNIGGAVSAEPVSATVLAVTFSVMSGLGFEAALALAVPVGLVTVLINQAVNVLFNLFAPMIDSAAAKGSEKGLYILHFGMWFLSYFQTALVVFIGVSMGAGPLETFMGSIPEVLMTGLTTTGSLLGAVGMAILMRMLWSKELAVFFFAGFILVKYLELPLIAVAVLAVVVAVPMALRDKENFDIHKKLAEGVAVGGKNDDVEDFFG